MSWRQAFRTLIRAVSASPAPPWSAPAPKQRPLNKICFVTSSLQSATDTEAGRCLPGRRKQNVEHLRGSSGLACDPLLLQPNVT